MTQELDTFRKAFELSLDTLVGQLVEAKGYLDGDGTDNMVFGTLLDIEDRFADFLAARRLFINSSRRAR